MPIQNGGGKGSASPVNPPQAPARDIVKETMQQRQQAAQAQAPIQQAPVQQTSAQEAPIQQAPVQQAAPVSPFAQQTQQQMPPQMMRGLGYGQQPGLQSMLARILGYGGGGGGYMPQGMPQQRMMPQQGYGQLNMPNYGRFGGQNPMNYRPDMNQVQQNLSRVKPSIQKQEQDAQAARIADLEAQLARYNTPSGE